MQNKENFTFTVKSDTYYHLKETFGDTPFNEIIKSFSWELRSHFEGKSDLLEKLSSPQCDNCICPHNCD